MTSRKRKSDGGDGDAISKALIGGMGFRPDFECEDMSDLVFTRESRRIVDNGNFFISLKTRVVPGNGNPWEISAELSCTTGDLQLLPYYAQEEDMPDAVKRYHDGVARLLAELSLEVHNGK